MRINEIFTGIQGEGKHAGKPMTFVRLSGCTRACSWCDTKYHTEGQEMSVGDLVKKLILFGLKDICFTGGEPLLQIEAIDKVNLELLENHFLPTFHIETNGDLINGDEMKKLLVLNFDFIGCSPKELSVAERVFEIFQSKQFRGVDKEIKIVWDGKWEEPMLEYADTIMPFTSGDWEADKKIMEDVWDYCLKNNKRFSPRLHYIVHGQKRGK